MNIFDKSVSINYLKLIMEIECKTDGIILSNSV